MPQCRFGFRIASTRHTHPPERLVFKWRHELNPELIEEGGETLRVIELEPVSDEMKLTITHTMDRADSKLIKAVSGGCPRLLSNLKSLLETGQIVMKANNLGECDLGGSTAL